MTLSKADRATITKARELLAEVDAASERHYPSYVARFKIITGELVQLIDRSDDSDTEFMAEHYMRLLNAGWEITSQKRLDGRYTVQLTHAMGSGSAESEDWYEAFSYAMLDAGI